MKLGDTGAAWLALVGFVLVATAQVSNIILARALAGAVPPFWLAFCRWSIVALGLLPFAIREVRDGRLDVRGNAGRIAAAGFCGMFLCGGPIYAAGTSTTAINIALIMSLSPVLVLLLSRLFGLEGISPGQAAGMIVSFAGALLIIAQGDPSTLLHLRAARGDGLVVVAMLGWSVYTLLQTRVSPQAGLLGRLSVFAAAGAVCSLPLAVAEAAAAPAEVFSTRAVAATVFAGAIPGILAYTGFAYLGARLGSVRTSLMLYVGPVASALLSFAILREPPSPVQLIGGAIILGGVWLSLRR